MKGYIIVTGSGGILGRYEVDTNKPIAEELIRVIKEESLILLEGDVITFETE